MAQLIAATYYERVNTLTLVSTTPVAELILGPAHQGWGDTVQEVVENSISISPLNSASRTSS